MRKIVSQSVSQSVSKGFTLLEIMVAVGLVSGLAVAIMSLTKTGRTSQVEMEAAADFSQLEREVVYYLSDPNSCKATFGGIVTTGLFGINNMASISTYDTNNNIIQKIKPGNFGKLKIKEIDLVAGTGMPIQWNATNVPKTYQASVVVKSEKNIMGKVRQNKDIKVAIFVKIVDEFTISPGRVKVESCVAKSPSINMPLTTCLPDEMLSWDGTSVSCVKIPVDCIGSWGPCDNNSGIKMYSILQEKKGSGASCPSNAGETKNCGQYCPSQIIANCVLPAQTDLLTKIVSGTCDQNYSGSCSYLCSQGSWTPSSNTCTHNPVNCIGSWGPCDGPAWTGGFNGMESCTSSQIFHISTTAAYGGQNCNNSEGDIQGCGSCTTLTAGLIFEKSNRF